MARDIGYRYINCTSC